MKRFFLLVGALLLLASCTTEFDQLLNGSRSDKARQTTVFQASVEGCGMPETKVYADENLKVLWNADDRISIFNKTTFNYQFAFTGDDGDTAGSFEEIPTSDFITGTEIDNIYAVYPYDRKNKLSNSCVLTVTLPSEQAYKESSFGIGANTMVAASSGNFLAFKNVGGYLNLRLYGDDVSVSRITIKGNNGEKIAGKASIEMPLGGVPTVTMDNSATDEVSVVCNLAVKIGADANNYTDFWFVIPPVYFSLGFTITVTDDKGGVFERTTSKALTINRNTLEWMAALEVVPDYTNANVPFEDANFKAYCVENFDNNEDGEISFSEAGVVTSISCDRRSIQSLSGIEYFTNLTELHCNDNQLTSLNVSLNTALTNLECRSNQLTSLEVSHNTSLTSLNCFSNQLSSLDVSSNTALLYLHCGDNQLTSLNIANNTALQTLGCDINQFTRLDVSHNTALTALSCDSNQLANLDVSHNAALTALRCCSNSLTRLDVSFNTALEFLECAYNQLTSLDVSHNTSLNYLKCSPMAELQYLYVANGQTIPNVTENRSTDFIPAKTEIVVSTGDNVIFADANFKAYCVENFDKDDDGEISMAEANAVTEINVNTEIVASLKGIEYFKNLKSLTCRLNYYSSRMINGERHYYNANNEEIFSLLTSLDISHNTALTYLNCNDNQLTSLDVSHNTALSYLSCDSNQLTSLDVSKNIALTTLDCGPNQLTDLDVSQNTALMGLSCEGNRLRSLDLSHNIELFNFACSNNLLTALDVSNNTKLNGLHCSSNQLTSLDVSNNTSLNYLDCSPMAELQYLYVANGQTIPNVTENRSTDFIPAETEIVVSTGDNVIFADANFKAYCVENFDKDGDGEISMAEANDVTTITVNPEIVASLKGIEYFKNLQSLTCRLNYSSSKTINGKRHYYNANGEEIFSLLTSLDLSHNAALTRLDCRSNQLTSLDVSNCAALTYLNCGFNQLTSLDVSYNTELTDLDCYSNQLTSLDVSHNTALSGLYCSSNQLTSLDVSHNTALTSLSCYSNQLTTLDVSNNTALTDLFCYSNQLTSLNVSYNTALTNLSCYSNQLTSLDVSHNTELTYLHCYSNQLTSLDVSHCAALTYLNCGFNQLTSLDVSNNTALTDLDCYSNQLSSLDVSHNTALTYLYCHINQLTSLDISNNPSLLRLWCYSNQLSSLDVSHNTALTELYCFSNPSLTEIWLKTGQVIGNFSYDTSVATIKYKE